MTKNTRTYWYNYLDIGRILNGRSNNGLSYYVADSTSQNSEQALQRVNGAFEISGPEAEVILINLGHAVYGVYVKLRIRCHRILLNKWRLESIEQNSILSNMKITYDIMIYLISLISAFSSLSSCHISSAV